MSTFSGYTTKTFSPTQKFFVLDPNTGTPSFVQGSDLVAQLTPNSSYVFAESTRTTAQATDYELGKVIQTGGATSIGDGQAGVYLVVAAGAGDFPMDNGLELLTLAGDDTLLERLALNTVGEGSDLVAHTGTSDTVTEALDKRTIYVGSVAELEALSPASDGQEALVHGSPFKWDATAATWKPEAAISVRAFGAVGDGVADDRPALQAALDYVAARADIGGELRFHESDNYRIGSAHPTHTQHGLVFDPAGNEFLRGQLTMYSPGQRTAIITLDTPTNITSLFWVKVGSPWMDFSGIVFDANNKAQFALKANDDYSEHLKMYGCRFEKALDAAASIATYVSVFELCIFASSKDGLRIDLGEGTGSNVNTALTMNSCYSLANSGIGYDLGFLTYAVLNACACDACDIGYKYRYAYAVAMNACGAERVRRPIVVDAFQGIAINTFYMLSCGSTDVLNPEPYLIELVTGRDAVVSGIKEPGTGRYYTYKLGLTSADFGGENITVLDNSVIRRTAYWVTGGQTTFARPIKFLRDDESKNNQTISIANADTLKTWILEHSDYAINHDITLQLADGTYDLTGFFGALTNISGSGNLVIAGNSGNNAAVKIVTQSNTFKFIDINCDLRFKDLTISGNNSGSFEVRLLLTNCNRAYLDNSLIIDDGLVIRYGAQLVNSNLYLVNGGKVVATSIADTAYSYDDQSRVIMEKGNSAPTSGAWSAGMRMEVPAPGPGGWSGIICTTGGSPGTWKAFGAVQA